MVQDITSDREDTFFSIAGRVVGDDIVVDVTGDLDLATAERLEAVLQDAVVNIPGDIVVDVSKVTFLDSTGLAALVRAVTALDDERSLRLARPSAAVRHPLELANMLEFFPLVE